MGSGQETTFSPLDGDDGNPDYSASASSHVGTTFGVEIEFAVATLREDEEDPHPDDTRQVYGILAGRGETKWNGPSYDDTEKVQIHMRNSINTRLKRNGAVKSEMADRLKDTSSHWWVGDDSTVKGPDDLVSNTNYNYVAVEIKTPAFKYCIASLLEVQAVCEHLVNNYRIFAGRGRSASVHVHVGFGVQNYSICELRKVMAIWWVFEPQFYSLVSKHRRKNWYCRNIRENSHLSDHLTREGKRVRDGLERIMETDSIQELVELFRASTKSRSSGEGRLGFNVLNVQVYPFDMIFHANSTKKTIEFRLHEATVQAEEIKQWVCFCNNLVAFAAVVKTEKVHLWLRMHMDENEEPIGVGELLRALKMPEQAAWFEKKMERMREDGEEDVEYDSDGSDGSECFRL